MICSDAVQKQAESIAATAIQDRLKDYMTEDFKEGRSDLSKDSVCGCLNCTRKRNRTKGE